MYPLGQANVALGVHVPQVGNLCTIIFNTISVSLYQSLTKYYENVCQKIKTENYFHFPYEKNINNFSRLFQAGKSQNFSVLFQIT